ncbi:MAG: DUF4190 domain-containing protein [Mycobacterium sp.]
MTTSGPEEPGRGIGPLWDYPADAGLPPPLYPPPYPGYYQPYPTPPGYPPAWPLKPPGTNGKAVAALVTSLGGMVCCGLPAVVGLVLGIVAMRETKRTGQDGHALAVAAVVVSTVVLVGYFLYLSVAILLNLG